MRLTGCPALGMASLVTVLGLVFVPAAVRRAGGVGRRPNIEKRRVGQSRVGRNGTWWSLATTNQTLIDTEPRSASHSTKVRGIEVGGMLRGTGIRSEGRRRRSDLHGRDPETERSKYCSRLRFRRAKRRGSPHIPWEVRLRPSLVSQQNGTP